MDPKTALYVQIMAIDTTPSSPIDDPDEFEIFFYGMMCFDPITLDNGKPAYRVLFPDALEERDGIPVHLPAVWVRQRHEKATARWSGFIWKNDFYLHDKRDLKITGLASTPLEDSKFNGHVANLKESDPAFEISETARETAVELVVDRGTLSAHIGNPRGMIVVRWRPQIERGQTVRFQFGDEFIEIPAGAKQVILANAGLESDSGEDGRHFLMYRRLAKDKTKDLKHIPPTPLPKRDVTLIEPTLEYAIRPFCPDIVCSAVQSKLR